MITGKLYDYLKFFALIVLPALGTLYFALADLWGLPAAEQVVGSIVALDTFLGVILGISQVTYTKGIADAGVMNVTQAPDGSKNFSLELTDHPDALAEKNEVRFKVKKTRTRGAAKSRSRTTKK